MLVGNIHRDPGGGRSARAPAVAGKTSLSVKPHAFVAMPFGIKPGPGGQPIDFDRVYVELVRPALDKPA